MGFNIGGWLLGFVGRKGIGELFQMNAKLEANKWMDNSCIFSYFQIICV